MKQGQRRLTRRIAGGCGVILAGVLAAWLVMLALGIPVSLNGLRQPVEITATKALGRKVEIDGPLSIVPTLPPTLVMHDVRIAGTSGAGELLRAARVVAWLAPFSLLRGEPHSKRLLIEDISINPYTRETERGTGPAEPGGTQTGVHHRLLSAGTEFLAQQPGLQELLLRRIVLNVHDDNAEQSLPVKLDEVSVYTRPGQTLKLQLRGHIQQQPYTVDLTGGRLADLLTPATSWPVQAGVSFADTRLLLNGKLEVTRQALELAFELQADWPERFAARLGQASLPGRLSLRTDRGRPVVGGELRLPALDAVLHLGAGAGVVGVANARPNHDGTIQSDGAVSVPLTVSIADTPFHGQLHVTGQGKETVAELELTASDVDAGQLFNSLVGTSGIRGRIRQTGLLASVRSGNVKNPANRVSLALQVDDATLSYGNTEGGQPVAMTADELLLTMPAGGSVTMRARGSLLDEPIAIDFEAGGLAALLAEDTWPVKLHATGGGAVLDASGPLSVYGNLPTRLHVSLYGQRVGELAAWLGVSRCAGASYTLRGELVLAEDLGRLQFLQLRTDTTRLDGDLDWSGDDRIALMHAVLQFESLDPADIEALIPLVSQASDNGVPGRGIAIDIPVLPRPIEIVNADIKLDIAQILLKLVDISEVSLSAEIRDGKLQRSPFRAQIGNAGFQGYLDPATAETGVVFENEDDDTTGGRIDKLFSSVVRWTGSNAIVPLRWFFIKKLAAADPNDCDGVANKGSDTFSDH